MKPTTAPAGLAGKIVSTLLATVLLVAGFMFSLVFLAVATVLGAIGLTYVWWKTRAIRRALRERMAASNLDRGNVIEGEATVIRDGAGSLPPAAWR